MATLKGTDEVTKEELVEMLEEIMSITEPLTERLSLRDREAWFRISAVTADVRDGSST
jgi:hypothetical protein